MAQEIERLTEDEEQFLIDEGVFISPSEGHSRGKRKVSAAFLSSSSASQASSSAPSVRSTISVSYHARSQEDLVISAVLESPDTIEFLGLKQGISAEIFDRWMKRSLPDQNPDELIDYVCAHTALIRRWGMEGINLTDAETLSRLGVQEWLSDVIINPVHAQVYETQTLQYWLDDTFKCRFRMLRRIQAQLKTYATIRGGGKYKKKKQRGDLETVFPGTVASSSKTPAPPAPTVAPAAPFTGKLLTYTAPSNNIKHFPAAHTSLSTDTPEPIPGHLVLWKGKAECQLRGTGALVSEDGVSDFKLLDTDLGGDFNSELVAWYWSEEKATAEVYRFWAAERTKDETWIIRIQLSGTFVKTLNIQRLYLSFDWKQFVWLSKKRADIPGKFQNYVDADVIVGHICRGSSEFVEGIEGPNVQEKMSDRAMVLSNGRKATQWVILNKAAASKIFAEARGKTHIEVTGRPSQ